MPSTRPVAVADTASETPDVVPETAYVAQPAVKPESVQMRKDVVVAAPFADTVAFRVAPVPEIDDAATVVTLGAEIAEVVNDRIVPFVVPAEFTPTAR